MNRFTIILTICGAFLLAALAIQTVSAQSEPLSSEQITRIRQNCVRAQTTLSQLRVSDAGLRNNRGTLYEQISTKLMAPLNSRIAINRLSGLSLATTSLEYDKQLATFRTSYGDYYDSMSEALKINCAEQPEAFYVAVTATREKRQKLHENSLALNSLLQTYKTNFEDFAKTVEGSTQ